MQDTDRTPTEQLLLRCLCAVSLVTHATDDWLRLERAVCKLHIARCPPDATAWLKQCGCAYVNEQLLRCACCTHTREFQVEYIQRLVSDIAHLRAQMERSERPPPQCTLQLSQTSQ